MRCAGYIRVSTNKEEQKSSIENQKSLFINYIKEQNWIISDFYIDIDTGTTGKRESLQRLIKDAQLKKFDVIIAKELSRLARNGSLSYQIRDIAQQNQIGIITLDGAINSINGDVSKYGLYTWLYEEESQRTSERVKSALKARAYKGLFKGSIPPYGYYVNNGHLYLKNDFTVEVVEWIFKEYIAGRGFDAIARELYTKEVPSPSIVAKKQNSTMKWYGSGVRSILENPHYTGNLVQQRETTISVTNKSRVENPKENLIVISNSHEAIISKETFRLVQDLIKNRAKKRVSSNKHLFTSLINCNDCNSAMHYKDNRKGYICGGYVKLTKKFCTHHAIKEDTLIKQILEDLFTCKNLINSNDIIFKLDSINDKEKRLLDKQLSNLNEKIEHCHSKKAKLLNLLIEEIISKEDYHTHVNKLEEDIAQIKMDKRHLAQILEFQNHNEEIAHLKEILVLINNTLDKSTINQFIKNIKVMANGTATIQYRFQTLNHLNTLIKR